MLNLHPSSEDISEMQKRRTSKRKYKKICLICGKDFFGRQAFQKYCSRECVKKGPMGPIMTKSKRVLCLNCHRQFSVQPCDYEKKFCSHECATAYRWKKQGTNWTLTETRILLENYDAHRKIELMRLLPRHTWDSITQYAFNLGYKEPNIVSKKCLVCGKQFIQKLPSFKKIFCSAECRQKSKWGNTRLKDWLERFHPQILVEYLRRNRMDKECGKCGLPPDLCVCEDIELEEDRMRRMKVKSVRIQGKYKGRGKQRNREA